MNKLLQRRVIRQFIKFGIVGIVSTAIDWGLFYLLNFSFGIYYLTAKVLSFAVAVINSFVWNRRWTFRSQNPNRNQEFVKFLVIALVGLSLNTLIMYLAVSIFHTRKIVGLIFATGIVTFWNFLANKYWTFQNSQK